jgi:hypothetical protein
MAPRVTDLARRAVQQFTREVPLYGLLPQEELDGEILDVTVHNIRLFLRVLADDRRPTPDELASIVASATRRAEEGVPLADVLAAYHIGGRLGWLEFIDSSGPEDVEELFAAGVHLLRYMQELTSAVSSAYLEVQQTIHGEERVARQELATALLTGRDPEPLAERADITLAPCHVVLVLALSTAATTQLQLDAGAAIASRRRVRLLQAELDAFAGLPVLGRLDAHGGTVLLPATPTTIEEVDVALAPLLDRLRDRTGEPLHGAAAAAISLEEVAGAASLARDVVDLAHRLGQPPGLYRLDDVLLEYQLTRPGPAREALARKLDRIADQPQLLETLRIYMGHERQRLRTAEVLHVHPNTLGYRLGRIATLTGLDPTSHTDSQILAAALVVQDD